jgi:hypothetical protein
MDEPKRWDVSVGSWDDPVVLEGPRIDNANVLVREDRVCEADVAAVALGFARNAGFDIPTQRDVADARLLLALVLGSSAGTEGEARA